MYTGDSKTVVLLWGGSPPLALHLEWVLQNIPFCPSCIWRSWVTEDDGVLCCAAVALVCEIAIISLCGEKNGRGDRDIDAIYFCNGLSESATHLQNKDRCFNWPMARRLFFFILFLAMMATLLRSDLSSGFLHFAYPRRFNSCFVSFSIEGERIYGWEREKKTNIMDCKPPNNRLGNRWLMNTHGAQWPRTIIHCAYLNSVSLLNSWTLFFHPGIAILRRCI